MLWQKESKAENALFIDLCKPLPNNIDEFETFQTKWKNFMLQSIERNFVSKKNNEVSLKLRQEGNSLYAESKWDQAMDKYNRSLCFAENDSSQIGLAYGNRSACFHKMKMYNKCLIDIDLAKKANYPAQLMTKLKERAKNCEESISGGLQAVTTEAKLGYESHKDYPGMANILQIVADSKFGRQVVTTKNINIGETVLVEKMYFGESYVRKYETCTVCLKSNTNLVPCRTCTFAMLCYDCKGADLHRLECGIRKCPNDGLNFAVGSVIPVVRSILMAVKLFPNTFDLMNFVQKAIASDPMEIPTMGDDKAMYCAFLKVHKRELNAIESHHVHFFYTSLLEQTELAPYFSIEKYRRFFMHLIMHHAAVFRSNKITSTRLVGGVDGDLMKVDFIFEDVSMGLLKTYFNHSCGPNIAFYCDNGSIVGKIIRPVISGEQLFVSYHGNLMGSKWKHPISHEILGFVCDCSRCNSKVDEDTNFQEDLAFASNSDYLLLRNTFSPLRSYPDESKRKIIEEKCVILLKQFRGRKWSLSLDYVMQAYIAVLTQATSSPLPKYIYLTNIVGKPGIDYTADMFNL